MKTGSDRRLHPAAPIAPHRERESLSPVVLLIGSWDPARNARTTAIGRALTDAGRPVTVVAPASPAEFAAASGVGFIPARRQDDADMALTHLFARHTPGPNTTGDPSDGQSPRRTARDPMVIECFDAPALRCALAWRSRLAPDARPRVTVLADAACPTDEPASRHADAVLCPTAADASRWIDAGFDLARIQITPPPVAPRPSFEPGGESVLCLTAIGPDRGLAELIDAWAASGSANEGVWNLILAGRVEDPAFARNLARRAASCPGVAITVRTHHPELDIAGCAVVIDTDGQANPRVLEAGARARPVFAPAGSPTAELACDPAGPFIYDPSKGVRDLIRVFDLLGDRTARDFAEPGQNTRARILARTAAAAATATRAQAYLDASLTPRAEPGPDSIDPTIPHQKTIREQTGPEQTGPEQTGPEQTGRHHPQAGPDRWGDGPRVRSRSPDAARLERALLACRAQGLGRIALYGAGAFVKRCADALCEPPVEVVGFIDDDPDKQGARVWGFTILSTDVALTGSLDAVILTAPSCEDALWQRTAWFRQARVRVIPLDRDHPDLAPARAA